MSWELFDDGTGVKIKVVSDIGGILPSITKERTEADFGVAKAPGDCKEPQKVVDLIEIFYIFLAVGNTTMNV